MGYASYYEDCRDRLDDSNGGFMNGPSDSWPPASLIGGPNFSPLSPECDAAPQRRKSDDDDDALGMVSSSLPRRPR